MAGSTRQAVLVIGLGVLLVGALLFKSIFFSGRIGHISPPPKGFYTDAVITAALIDGVARNYGDAGAQIGTSASGGPDPVRQEPRRVQFGTLDPGHAKSLCATIAGMYDRDTPAGRSPSLARSSRPAARPSRSVAETLAGLPRQGDRTGDRGNRVRRVRLAAGGRDRERQLDPELPGPHSECEKGHHEREREVDPCPTALDLTFVLLVRLRALLRRSSSA